MGRYIYIMSSPNPDRKASQFLKIGISSDVEARRQGLQVGNPNRITIESTFMVADGNEIETLEETIHGMLANYHVRGEWFCVPILSAVKIIEAVLIAEIIDPMMRNADPSKDLYLAVVASRYENEVCAYNALGAD